MTGIFMVRNILRYFFSLLVFCSYTSYATGTDPSASFTVTAQVIRATCSFSVAEQLVTLPGISTLMLTDTSPKNIKNFSIELSCGSGVKAFYLIPSGTPDDINPSDFANTGSAKNIALRLFDKDGNILRPDGTSKVSVIPADKVGNYTFKAGYVATKPNSVTGGSFVSLVNLNIEYD